VWASFENGNELYGDCTESDGTPPTAYCLGFVAGVFDTAEMLLLDSSGRLCAPKSVTLGQVRDVIVKYLRENPAERNLPASLLALRAVQAAWPCPK
jgi:hypothetical protein